MREDSGKIGGSGTFMDLTILNVPMILFPPALNDFHTYDRTVRHDSVAAGCLILFRFPGPDSSESIKGDCLTVAFSQPLRVVGI